MSERPRDAAMADDAHGFFARHKAEILSLFANSASAGGGGGRSPSFSVPKCGPDKEVCVKKVKTGDGGEVPDPLFDGGLGRELSDVYRVRLKAFLDQGLEDLDDQYQKLFDCVLAVRKIRNHLVGVKDEADGSPSCGSKSAPPNIDEAINTVVDSLESKFHEEPRRDFREILESGGSQAETALKQYSNDLCAKLKDVVQQINDFIVVIVSKCRDMTYMEIEDLWQRVFKLPGKAAFRLVEIIKHSKSPTIENDGEIQVDLNLASNSLLWRLHYYAKLVETENKPSPGAWDETISSLIGSTPTAIERLRLDTPGVGKKLEEESLVAIQYSFG